MSDKMEDVETSVNLGGRPPHTPTEQDRFLVAELSKFGVKRESIAKRLRICPNTLNKHYEHELEDGLTDAIQQAGNKLWSKAVDEGDLTALIFYLKTRGGWSEKRDDDKDKDNRSLLEQALDKIPSANK